RQPDVKDGGRGQAVGIAEDNSRERIASRSLRVLGVAIGRNQHGNGLCIIESREQSLLRAEVVIHANVVSLIRRTAAGIVHPIVREARPIRRVPLQLRHDQSGAVEPVRRDDIPRKRRSVCSRCVGFRIVNNSAGGDELAEISLKHFRGGYVQHIGCGGSLSESFKASEEEGLVSPDRSAQVSPELVLRKRRPGKPVPVACESINPGMLSKQGWSRRTLNPGDKVTIIGFPARVGSKVMLLEKLI